MERKIWAIIRDKRTAHGLSQEELAEKIGKTPSFVGQIERGVSLPSLETLSQITRLLTIDANLFFHGDCYKHQESQEFYLMINQLSPDMRKLAFEIIKQIRKFGRID